MKLTRNFLLSRKIVKDRVTDIQLSVLPYSDIRSKMFHLQLENRNSIAVNISQGYYSHRSNCAIISHFSRRITFFKTALIKVF